MSHAEASPGRCGAPSRTDLGGVCHFPCRVDHDGPGCQRAPVLSFAEPEQKSGAANEHRSRFNDTCGCLSVLTSGDGRSCPTHRRPAFMQHLWARGKWARPRISSDFARRIFCHGSVKGAAPVLNNQHADGSSKNRQRILRKLGGRN